MAHGKRLAVCVVALALPLLEAWLMNVFARPIGALHDPAPIVAIHLVEIAVYSVVAFAARLCAGPPSLRAIGASCVVATVLGAALMFQPNLLGGRGFQVGVCLINAVRAMSLLVALMLFVNVGRTKCAVAILLAVLCSYIVLAFFVYVAPDLALLAFAIIPTLCLALALPGSEALIASWGTDRAPLRDLSAVNPSSFLPFTHTFFVALLVFRMASGVSLAYGEEVFDGLRIIAAACIVCVAFLAARGLGRRSFSDALYMASAVLVLAGFAVVALPWIDASVSRVLWSAGSDAFRVLAFFVLISVARRNPRAAVLVFAWGLAALTAGSLLGNCVIYAAEWLGGDDLRVVEAVLVTTGFLFAVYNIVGLHSFSWERTIEGVEGRRVPEPVSVVPDFDAICDRAASLYGLTKREGEVLRYLARGRSVPYMQEVLSVSGNTVRTHVKHIYAKMDVRSQQQLISLLEGSLEV